MFQPFLTDKPGHDGLGLARAAQVLRAHPGAAHRLRASAGRRPRRHDRPAAARLIASQPAPARAAGICARGAVGRRHICDTLAHRRDAPCAALRAVLPRRSRTASTCASLVRGLLMPPAGRRTLVRKEGDVRDEPRVSRWWKPVVALALVSPVVRVGVDRSSASRATGRARARSAIGRVAARRGWRRDGARRSTRSRARRRSEPSPTRPRRGGDPSRPSGTGPCLSPADALWRDTPGTSTTSTRRAATSARAPAPGSRRLRAALGRLAGSGRARRRGRVVRGAGGAGVGGGSRGGRCAPARAGRPGRASSCCAARAVRQAS